MPYVMRNKRIDYISKELLQNVTFFLSKTSPSISEYKKT